jgi:hypothetical protein
MWKPAVLVGDSLYWTFIGNCAAILEFDLERQSLAVIQLPVDDMSKEKHEFTVMRAEGGGLGLLLLSEFGRAAQLWMRKTDCDGLASGELGRTIELDKLLSLNSAESEHLTIIGFAECNNVVFLWTFTGLFMVELESLQFKKVPEMNTLCFCTPFESVYAAGNGMPSLYKYNKTSLLFFYDCLIELHSHPPVKLTNSSSVLPITYFAALNVLSQYNKVVFLRNGYDLERYFFADLV